MGELFGSSEAPHEENLLRGLAASGGVYEGPARRVAGPTEFGRIVQGDVLVTESTTEAFNILLPLLGAIVTDSGGLLSHSAIVAREYGIPGVVGTRERDRAHPRRRARTRRRRCGRSDGLLVRRRWRGRPARRRARGLALRREGHRTGSGGARRAADPARYRALGRDRRRGRRRATSARSSSSCRGPVAGRRRSRCARRRSTRTARRRASPASTSRCSTCRRSTTCSAAIREIWWSANSDSAITYRQRVGLFTRPSVGVVVQSLLDPDVAGVMFTQNPINGADERLIEASWGLGEVVVAGRVIPDSFRIDRGRRGARAHARGQEDRDPCRGRRRHRRGDGRAGARRAALPRRRSARAARRARRAVRARSTDRRATSSGRSRAGSSTCCSAGR